MEASSVLQYCTVLYCHLTTVQRHLNLNICVVFSFRAFFYKMLKRETCYYYNTAARHLFFFTWPISFTGVGENGNMPIKKNDTFIKTQTKHDHLGPIPVGIKYTCVISLHTTFKSERFWSERYNSKIWKTKQMVVFTIVKFLP